MRDAARALRDLDELFGAFVAAVRLVDAHVQERHGAARDEQQENENAEQLFHESRVPVVLIMFRSLSR